MKTLLLLPLCAALMACGAAPPPASPQVASSVDAVKFLVVLTSPGNATCPAVHSDVQVASSGLPAEVSVRPRRTDVTVKRSTSPQVDLTVSCRTLTGERLGEAHLTWDFGTLPSRVQVGPPGATNVTFSHAEGTVPGVQVEQD